MKGIVYCGYKYVKYVSKRTGKETEGYSVYFTSEENNVVGLCAYDAWVSVETFQNYFSCVKLGTSLVPTYDRYGNIIGCVPV